MSREIKFRAWDKDTERMTTTFSISSQGQVTFTPLGESPRYLSGYLIMQFTGLKDKTGKEIYEGDIVKIYNESTPEDSEDEKEIMEIKWDKQGGYISSVTCGYEFDPLIGNDDIEMEIIGNIHETPELLEKEAEERIKYDNSNST